MLERFGRRYEVIAVGSATVDVFAYTEHADIIRKHGKRLLAYPAGAKLLVKELLITTGGGGTNAAVGFSRLGSRAAFLGKLGDDENAETVIKKLKAENVDFLGMRDKKGMTSFSIVLDSVLHDRTILTYKGVSNDLRFSEISKGKLRAKWFYFSSMLGESFRTLEKLAEFAGNKGISLTFNPSAYLAEKGLKGLGRILKHTTILVLNKEEAELLAKKGSVEKNLGAILKSGPEMAVITDGKKPLYASDGKFVYKATPPKVGVVETTGAGDSFATGFTAGIMRSKGMEFSIQLGLANSASTVSHHGAKTGLLGWQEAIKLMRRRPVKVLKKKF